MKVIHCGSYPVLKYIKIICDITLHGKGSIMSRMTNAPYSPACAQPSGPSDALSILVAPLCTWTFFRFVTHLLWKYLSWHIPGLGFSAVGFIMLQYVAIKGGHNGPEQKFIYIIVLCPTVAVRKCLGENQIRASIHSAKENSQSKQLPIKIYIPAFPEVLKSLLFTSTFYDFCCCINHELFYFVSTKIDATAVLRLCCRSMGFFGHK